jgi:hypothetical protein
MPALRGMTVTPEGKIKKKVNDLLAKYEGLYYSMPVPSGFGKSDLDYVGCFHGKYFQIETKRPNKAPTVLQRRTIVKVQEAGGIVFTVNCDEDIEVLRKWLEWNK